MSSESRIWEIRLFGSMRGRRELVIGPWPFNPSSPAYSTTEKQVRRCFRWNRGCARHLAGHQSRAGAGAALNQQVGALTSAGSTGTITNSSTTSDSTLTVNPAAPSVFAGAIKDSAAGGTGTGKVGLTLAGGTLTLQGTNTFTGDATISAGTLALSQMGSLNSTAGSIIIGAGETFDVSGVTSPPANVPTGKTLSGGGVTGGATINGALVLSGGSSLSLTYVSGTPAINVTGGELTLNANPTTVTVSGAALGAGSYKLISAGTGGSVAGTLPGSVTVGGSGLAANTTASLSIISGELWCVVQAVNRAPTSPERAGVPQSVF
jgi:autotransporter-associated beta strand protein